MRASQVRAITTAGLATSLISLLLVSTGQAYADSDSGWSNETKIVQDDRIEVEATQVFPEDPGRNQENTLSGDSSSQTNAGNGGNDGSRYPSRQDSDHTSTQTLPENHISNQAAPANAHGRKRPQNTYIDGMNTALCNTGETIRNVTQRTHMENGIAYCPVATPEPAEPAVPATAAPAQQPAAQPATVVEAEEPELPVVTLNDLQTMFAPESEIIMDQNGFGLINAHTNVYASTYRPQTQSQEMLGYQVTLRITPVSWAWSFGDGSTLTTDVPGHPQDRFNEETPTSHVYTETGTFPVDLTTTYEGDYQIEGGAWIPVAGTMSVNAETQQADIWRAKTRNVAEPCTPGSTAWGCTG